ncbi:16S rRNA (uracil(1498)-N(3))-methyltransferase [Kushneria aurantia]|uniref:Ribosomal RNA small subunit methyltransferase E n=1 Tax=Kushneria aurantia TaxID=504092 RepID=A0ABV6G5D1_9GAMM|nr:16S rRNA (uracil(1498)-N(3))-methyltransferase [Kushneria aurantia]
MNLLLLTPHDLLDSGRARIHDSRRLRHLVDVHRAAPGDELTVGMENGGIGRARLVRLDGEHAEFHLGPLDETPPPPLPLHLILALPRPRMLARTLENIAALGVKRLTLLHTARVEKSYWQSPELADERIDAHLRLGLEQARDTRLPVIQQRRRFRPFVEDELPALLEGHRALVAHPGGERECPRGLDMATLLTLAIGPEGGFVDYEIAQLRQAGFEQVHLGPRILRVETAVVALLARLY